LKSKKTLQDKILKKKAEVAVMGLGYVGLPLALAFVQRGFKTQGVEVSTQRVRDIKRGVSYVGDVPSSELSRVRKEGRFEATTEWRSLKKADVIVVCVPTPLSKSKQPDLSFVLKAMKQVARVLRKGQLIILESTTYPGTTEEHILPLLQKDSGLKVERDFFLGFSPERVDPANEFYRISEIPKVIGSVGPHSLEIMRQFYSAVFSEVVPVSSARSAEMVKLLENTFRSVNIGLINEMSTVCHILGIDIWEVINAASTKPFGFMPFYPGPGIGGHCINIDPAYLSWKARLHGCELHLIELAQSLNDAMPQVVVERIRKVLNTKGIPVKRSKILVMGVAYKKNVADTRESPCLTIIEKLLSEGARLTYHDPHVASIRIGKKLIKSQKLLIPFVKKQDLVVILTNHDKVDYTKLGHLAKHVFDTRNAMEGIVITKGKVTKL
jgi:UDP-N-acetyl-D-glucosamine dehydrogenase